MAGRVSRETLARLELLLDHLSRWQRMMNLVAPGTLDEAWDRHVADSLQLLDLAADGHWVDFGSGGGFPGLVLAIAGRERADFRVTLVESNTRKCAFLREVVRVTAAAGDVVQARIETVAPGLVGATAVTARAVAALPQLLSWVSPLLTTGSVGLFPKGRDVAAELTAAREEWRFDAELLPSRTASDARIVRVTSLAPRS